MAKKKTNRRSKSTRKTVKTAFGTIEVHCSDDGVKRARNIPKKTKPKKPTNCKTTSLGSRPKKRKKSASITSAPKMPSKNAPVSVLKEYVRKQRLYLEGKRKKEKEMRKLESERNKLRRQASSLSGRNNQSKSSSGGGVRGILRRIYYGK